jgi:hypothetical protein
MTGYRYTLTREWESDTPGCVLWVMLNPSTADESNDDATIRKVTKFSKAWGYGSLEVVNLFAARATDPDELKRIAHPVGMENDHHIGQALLRASIIVAAWGASYPAVLSMRPYRMRKLLLQSGLPVHHLGLTKAGDPRHPLYVKDAEPLIAWSP